MLCSRGGGANRMLVEGEGQTCCNQNGIQHSCTRQVGSRGGGANRLLVEGEG